MNRITYLFTLFILLINSIDLWAQPACLGDQGQLKWLLWENVRDDELDDLTHLHVFPNNPDAHEIITELKSPGTVTIVEEDGNFFESVQYGTYYGSMIRGYLKVPQTGNYSFNITGDDEVKFLLSTDETRANLVTHAFVNTWTYRKQFAKAEEENNQTSDAISLNSNNYYYFEVWHKENGGGDHVEVLWKTPTNTADWQDIPSASLFDYACSLDCPKSGTPCDDGNANTINDIQDGFCNCTGTPTNASSCVGDRGEIKALYYLELPGNSMSSFLEADKYPLAPDTSEILELLQGPLVNRDTYGTRISGLIKVPVTGAYQFAVTCDDRNSFKLSTNESPDNAVEISYSNWSAEHNQYDEVTQIQSPVTLNKDNFYYFEMNHREATGSDRFSVFWRTPFSQDTLWRYIDKNYLYGYACEMACIPEGTPCNDGNNFTKDDKYDAACNCVGIPCQTGDCDDVAVADAPPSYPENEPCGVTDKTENSAADAWESCTPSANPNAGRGVSHWIQYDLGKTYVINDSHIWNYNAAGNTGKGFKDVVIDYSTDGTNWTQLGGMYTWDQATGVIGYKGFAGPNFNGILAQYILITALNNWENGACSGFSKITINATDCLLMGQACDDGDANSVNDHYDENCNCVGEGEGFSRSLCGEMELVQPNIMLSTSDYKAQARIISRGMVAAGNNVKLIAGESVTLMDGFHARAGSDFIAMIAACEETPTVQEETTILGFSKVENEEAALADNEELTSNTTASFTNEDLSTTNLSVWPNPTNSWTSLYFNLPQSTTASLCIFAADGKQVICLANDNKFSKGTYTKEFPAQRLAAGMYYVVLKTESEVLTKPLAVIE